MVATPKRKVTDYAGLAALVTALATASGLFWKQGQAEDTSAMVQDSALAVVEYRLGEAERAASDMRDRLRVIELEMAHASGYPLPLAHRSDAGEDGDALSGDTVDVVEMDEDDYEQTVEEAKEELVQKVRKRGSVRSKDIRQYVDKANRALALEDF